MPESEQEWKEAYEAREHNIAAARQQIAVALTAIRASDQDRALEAAENALRQLRDIAAKGEDDE